MATSAAGSQIDNPNRAESSDHSSKPGFRLCKGPQDVLRTTNEPPNWQYRPLERDKSDIRLLTFDARDSTSGFHCKLKHVTLGKAPAYSALSYAWGPAESPLHMIYINGQRHEVTKNLYDALYNFRDLTPGIRLWADAICIDQQNLEERGQQVQLMQKIFSQAEKTLIWLGVEADENNRAFSLIETCSKRFVDYQSTSLETSIDLDHGDLGLPSSWLAYDELLELERLFERLWIWVDQKVSVSRSVAVFCGHRSCSWDEVANAAGLLIWDRCRLGEALTRGLGIGGDPLMFTLGLDRILCIDSTYSALMKKAPAGKKSPRSLFHLLFDHYRANAADPRDKWAALTCLTYKGVSPLDDEVYKQKVKHICTIAAKSIIREEKEGRLKFLEYAGQPYQMTDLPSWVPDLSHTGERPKPLLFRQLEAEQSPDLVAYSAAGFNSTSETNSVVWDDDTLSAYGFIFDFVDGVSAGDRVGLGSSALHMPDEDLQMCQPKCITHQLNNESFDNIVDELWRTLVVDRADKGNRPPEDWKDLLYPTLLHLNKPDEELDRDSSFLKQWYDRNKSFQICGSMTFEDIVLQKGRGNSSNSSLADSKMMADIREQVFLTTNLKRLSKTTKGHLALMPTATQHGDTIAILFDCDLPVVLRRHETGFSFIGCCYVHGVMEGEAIAGYEKGKFNARSFDIR